jgi:hypothetical protein
MQIEALQVPHEGGVAEDDYAFAGDVGVAVQDQLLELTHPRALRKQHQRIVCDLIIRQIEHPQSDEVIELT